ncbi:MarR family winged helix-turn-helix transcriptional regulator [Sulfitobacter sp. JB4-11]|uniref:MarR family winged helix-turn-helix transcriptional regulator n=1 Tax=Sulfitobacter rhodophyticola TaxID=3238304 RepID=UPI003513A306
MNDSTDTLGARYVLEDQVGYLLRLASQQHAVIFQKHAIDNLTPTQFSTILRVAEVGEVSQNHLGRLTAMDVATIKGVVDRLKAKGLAQSMSDPNDKRRSIITLTKKGATIVEDLKAMGHAITEETLAPLDTAERKTFLRLLRKLG